MLSHPSLTETYSGIVTCIYLHTTLFKLGKIIQYCKKLEIDILVKNIYVLT